MCYSLEIITKKAIAEDTVYLLNRNYGLDFYNKTAKMKHSHESNHYYSVISRGCACDFYQQNQSNGLKLQEVMREYVKFGDVILFFIWQDEYYNEIEYDLHEYIDNNEISKINISITDFLKVFMTEKFEGESRVFIIHNDAD